MESEGAFERREVEQHVGRDRKIEVAGRRLEDDVAQVGNDCGAHPGVECDDALAATAQLVAKRGGVSGEVRVRDSEIGHPFTGQAWEEVNDARVDVEGG